MAKAIVSTVRPNASETPTNPIPRLGKAAASTALPQPPSTSHKVPMNSAVRRLLSSMAIPSCCAAPNLRTVCGAVHLHSSLGDARRIREHPGFQHAVLFFVHELDPVTASHFGLVERLIGELQCAPGT